MPPRNYRSGSRRSRWPQWLLGGFGLFTLITVGIVGTLWIAGVPLNPFASTVVPDDPFMVRIPINSKPIPAYTRVDRAHLLNPATGGLMIQQVPPAASVGMSIVGIDSNGSHVESRVEAVKNVNDEVVFVVTGGAEVRQVDTMTLGAAMLNINAILGRVVKADKRAGLGFQESTFFPRGTPEGLAGATPQGMRAITLDATQLTGVHSLGAGDQIDLLASVPLGSDSGDTEVQLLAQSAKVLRSVYVRNEVSSSASLMNGKTMQNVPKYEVAIAVAADDVIPLQNALNQKLPITCIAHSMKPASEADAQTMVSEPDLVSVPVTVRPIFAYDVVTRDAFVSPATRALKTEKISRQEADRIGAIVALGDAVGFIVRQDIPTGRYLRHSDLLSGPPGKRVAAEQVSVSKPPQGNQLRETDTHRFVALLQQPPSQSAPVATAVGDRPAITRFVPPGRTAFAIPWNRVYGSEHLQIGDEIDLMASYTLESTNKEEETETRPDGTVIVRKNDSLSVRETQRSWSESFGFRAEPWFVATDAIVIAPVGFPAPASALRAIGDQLSRPSSSSGGSDAFSGPPVIIAVDDRDVEAVTAALATRSALFTIAFHASDEVEDSLGLDSKLIVVASEPMLPYEEFSESMWLGNRRRITSRVVSSSDARFDDAITVGDVRSYYGRVLAKPKSRGHCLTETDFLPIGTKPGLAAGVQAGHTFIAVADREIEGLDGFETEDHVAILFRGVTQPIAGVETMAINVSHPSATVVVKEARIVRASLAGQTVLSIANQDLASLQAALARALTDQNGKDRSHLVAVVRPRPSAMESGSSIVEEIPAFDPMSNIRFTETIIGGKRSVKAFVGAAQ